MTAALQICGVLLFALGVLCASLAKPASDPSGFVRAGDALWTGEQIYISVKPEQTPTPVFVILGGSERYTAPNGQTFRAVKVRYPSGAVVWKTRDSIIRSDRYFVKKNDPALLGKQWRNLTD